MYNLMLIDVEKDGTRVHRMNVITGDYLTPHWVTGELSYQVNSLGKIILKERPDKIIFDRNGYGHVFYHYFMETQKYIRGFSVDSFGLITYGDEQ